MALDIENVSFFSTIFVQKMFPSNKYKVLLESSRTVIVVTALVKDERGGQGHTSASLLYQSAMRHRSVNTH
jgi:hypothetical protein